MSCMCMLEPEMFLCNILSSAMVLKQACGVSQASYVAQSS